MTENVLNKKMNRKGLVAGVALILIGVIALLGQFVESEILNVLILPGLGLVFLAWGLSTRQIGLVIPGCILIAVGAGAYIMGGPLAHLSEQQQGGVFVGVMGLGFFLITLVSVAMRPIHWWGLVPGSILLVSGAAIFMGGKALEVMGYIGKGWPVILIAIGLYLVLWRKGLQSNANLE